jgi:hypothetical protein
MVEERLAAGHADVEELAALISESLVDVILRVPVQEQAKLLAHTLSVGGPLSAEERRRWWRLAVNPLGRRAW